MESGDLANQPNPRKGQLVPAEQYSLPLLPYERDLIQVLGFSEQEYREFASEVSRKLREADFKGQPTADAITISIVSLVIGLALTAASVLLAPKPKQFNQKERRSIQLPSQEGRTRFNNNIGFEGAPQLAQLGSRIPIPFGMYVPETANTGDDAFEVFQESGGIVVEPLLVWSRMTSHGKYQTIKFLTVIGTSKISTAPDLPAIMFGGQSLANFYKSNYWVGWKSEDDDNIIRLSDTLYGEAAEGNNSGDGIFICPTFDSPAERGFSQVYTPANTTSFGVYEPIPNGGNFRLNWQISSFPEDASKDVEGKVQNERKKIAGNNAKKRSEGMKGTGRAYSVKCGVVNHNGRDYTDPTELECNIGDAIVYKIQPGAFTFDNAKIEEDSGVAIGDLNSRIDSIREAADEALQIGVIFVMNRTIFRVVRRPADIWTTRSGDMYYDLVVIGFTGANRTIGIIGTGNLEKWILSEGGDETPSTKYKGTGWYALSKMDIAQAKNTRPVEVTEIGIRAQVWSQANGLANFNTVPSPKKLKEYDEDNIQVQIGTISKYMRRTAFFVLGVRDPNRIQGLRPDGQEESTNDQFLEGYDIIDNVTFAVTGNKPVDQFSWIRIRHPGSVALEYRLIPKPAATMIRFREGQPPLIYVLRGGGEMRVVEATTNAYGPFRLDFGADIIPLDELYDLPEMSAGLQKVPPVEDCSNVRYELFRDTPSSGGGKWQAWLESLDGGAWNLKPTAGNSRKNIYGQSRSTIVDAIEEGGDRSVRMKVFGTVIDAGGQPRADSHGTAKAWQAGFELLPGQTGIVTKGSRWLVQRNVRSPATHHGNWFGLPAIVSQTFEVTTNGLCTIVTPGYEKEREFEDNAAIKEISPYQELIKSCDRGPELSISYVNESIGCEPKPNWYGMTVAGFKVRSLNQTTAFNQMQLWLPNGIDIPRLGPSSAYPDGRGKGTTGPSNNFADIAHYLLTATGAAVAAAGRSVNPELVATGWFEESARFISNYWMRYDGAISDSINLRDYLTEIAPFFLCNFVIQNGKCALKPALPQREGKLIEGPIATATFNDGNIVAGSFKLSYLPQSERQDFRANVVYRDSKRNSLTELRSILVQWDWDENNDDDPSNNITTVNQEDFDISSFCSRRSHAFAVARYMLSIRRRVDHVIEFLTTPNGLSVAPGDFIRVESQASPYEVYRNGAVEADGKIRTPTPLADGTHKAYVYKEGSETVDEMELEVKDGYALNPELYGSLFNVPGIARRLGVYQVESVGLEEDGSVKVTGSHHPVFDDLSSKIVSDVLNTDRFVVVEERQPNNS